MTSFDFLEWLCGQLRANGVRFAITSGQACVHFGLQQTTKDSDWIIPPDDLNGLRQMLIGWEAGGICQANYRPICGAPLDAGFLGRGWTSHLSIVERNSRLEHHVDVFGKPPRVRALELDPADSAIASRHVVAQMKKTDRDKDWPFVFSLGRQMLDAGDPRGVLHLQDADALIAAWPMVPLVERTELVRLRPLLALLDHEPARLRRAVAVERAIWVSVNRGRYQVFQRAWKDFFRRWRDEPNMTWPLNAGFAQQHAVLSAATVRHDLPTNPFDDRARVNTLAQAHVDVAEIMAVTEAEWEQICPLAEVLLP